MAAQRQDSDYEGYQFAPVGPMASRAVPDDGLDAMRGISWGLLVAVVGFWGPMLALTWRWLHR